ncbi:hypothetical protein GCM10009555_055580 [Acrocarpospora macrocephala]|uniref:tRNA nuclease CdiA C-terminal domain-containing protein n=1 Tax=Acrocarpospora macrocephala TaxID=150177 RepID=A0A5M3WNW5_9ACTN|nr:hypothetical protein [Acrocarpospora macrocephala]GES10624.1 hypothetical protein Amac_042210 [Acrocarpospora macrocephala]
MGESGLSQVDERARRFSDAERRVAEFLVSAGHEVIAVGAADPGARGRLGNRPDALVDGVPTDFVVLATGDTGAAVAMALSRAARHAEQAVIDARGSGLAVVAAHEGIRRFQAVPHSRDLRGWRVVGDGYDINAMSAAPHV